MSEPPIKDGDRLAMCDGKVKIASQADAKRAARRRHGRSAYKCPICGFWHVGQNRDGFQRNTRPIKEV